MTEEAQCGVAATVHSSDPNISKRERQPYQALPLTATQQMWNRWGGSALRFPSSIRSQGLAKNPHISREDGQFGH